MALLTDNQLIESINKSIAVLIECGVEDNLQEAASYLISHGGKRLRPMMCIRSAQSINENVQIDRLLYQSVAIEFIHAFSLIHDDIIDCDAIRHGIDTTHIKYGEATAINAGDLLLNRAYETISSGPYDAQMLRDLIINTSATTRHLSDGQQKDINMEKIPLDRITEADYIQMVRMKTGSLFALSAWSGGLIANATPMEMNSLYQFGMDYGIAFQIGDDLLSITSNDKTFGKTVGNDIRRGKRTLISIKASQMLFDKERDLFINNMGNENMTDNDFKFICDILKERKILSYVESVMEDYIQSALSYLSVLDDSISKSMLIKMTNDIMTRDH